MKKLSSADLRHLNEALHYLHVSELKEICRRLTLLDKGMKGELIRRILHFLENGLPLKASEIPAQSRAHKNKVYPLKASTQILFGSYKNDAKTRSFMKTLVGDHFHFTAFGQDWMKSRWLQGKPPTYAEFAEFWQKEYLKRREKKAAPKKEWAYINFIQKHPEMPRKEMTKAWKRERTLQYEKAWMILNKVTPP